MSIISSYEVDNSAALAKRFAVLATSYVDDPAAAQSKVAKVPLENLFRILEMYRYNAFVDENRRGILALESFDRAASPKTPSNPTAWHSPIEAALDKALKASFASDVSKEDAIEQLQEGLRELANKGAVTRPLADTVKKFFTTFQAFLV